MTIGFIVRYGLLENFRVPPPNWAEHEIEN